MNISLLDQRGRTTAFHKPVHAFAGRSSAEERAVTIDSFILPGLAGSPEGHWQHIWAEERDGSVMVMQDDWYHPTRAAWKARLEDALASLPSSHPGVFLVAHSLGCQLVASLAESPWAERVRGALLVAPCDLATTQNLHLAVSGFSAQPLSRLPFASLVISSDNDPYMPEDRIGAFVEALGSQHVSIGRAGHINVASGFGRFSQGYALFDAWRQEIAPALARI